MDGEPSSLSGGERVDDSTISSILGDLRQRRIIAMLLERSQPTTVDELRVNLITREAETAPGGVSESDHRSVELDLHHRCLPQLEDAGWIERRAEGVVVDEPLPIEAERLSLPDLQDPEHPSWDAVSVLLARPRRQDVVSVVAERSRSLTLEELVAELRDTRRASWGIPSDEDDRSLLVALHHVDLPKMTAVDLIEYDRAAKTVEPTARLPKFVDRTGLDTG